MKAYLLAAGRGERLRPLTDITPKCLLPLEGEPLLGHWLRACRRHGIEEVLVNTHHLADAVRCYVEGPALEHGVRIHLFHEPALLGSAGTVRAARDFVAGEESFFVIYADNLSGVDLGRMAAWHADHAGTMTVGLFRAPRPDRCGVAVLDSAGRVVAFEEKPATPRSPWASAGLYVARARLFEFLDDAWAAAEKCAAGTRGTRPAGTLLDFGFDILPRLALAGELHGYLLRGFLIDVGTPGSYAAAQEHLAREGRHG